MQANRLGEAWRIWICPCVLWYMHAGVLLFFFSTIEPLVADDSAGYYHFENMLVFATLGPMVAACYYIMIQYEKVRQVRVRRRTRLAFVFLAALYAVYTLIVVCDLVEEALV